MISLEQARERARVSLHDAKLSLNRNPDNYLAWVEVAGRFAQVSLALSDAGLKPGRAAAVAPTMEGIAGAVERLEGYLDRWSAQAAPGDRTGRRALALSQAADDACRELARTSAEEP